MSATPAVTADLPQIISVTWEVFSLPMEEAHQFLAAFKTDVERHVEIVKRAATSAATLEELQMIRTRSGQRAKVEAISEKIYPTEFVPPQQPAQPGLSKRLSDLQANALPYPSPVTLETRNTGTTLEIEPTLHVDGTGIDLSIAPEIVKFIGDDPITTDLTVKQPKFQTQKLTSSVTLKLGQPLLLGTQSPPHLSGIEGANTEKVVWLSFVTAELLPLE